MTLGVTEYRTGPSTVTFTDCTYGAFDFVTFQSSLHHFPTYCLLMAEGSTWPVQFVDKNHAIKLMLPHFFFWMDFLLDLGKHRKSFYITVIFSNFAEANSDYFMSYLIWK